MKKLLVANRGEIACRIMRAARACDVRTVAVYSDADAAALHVETADEAVRIGEPSVKESYLHVERVLRAAADAGADAIHPGYGFLSENAAFARAVRAAGLIWVGPSPDTIEAMGDKEAARRLAVAAGVPVLPGSDRLTSDNAVDIYVQAERVGYPLLVKASGGGGGMGMQRVDAPDALRKAVESAQALAARLFGDGAVFLERFVVRARHIEVQVFGFGDGRVAHLHERECSIQRRFQKVIEESPAPNLSEETRAALAAAAVKLASAQKYEGAGTVEFVYDDDRGEFYFLEMNTRIQVEHPVTELVTGLDLVAAQIQFAAQRRVAFDERGAGSRGHALECRLYAENPAKRFLPSPGRLEKLRFPQASEHVRIDTGVREGDVITPHYDPMIAKIAVWEPDRQSAIVTALAALEQTHIEGIASNLSFLKRVLSHRVFEEGRAVTSFIADYNAELVEA